MTVEYRLIPDTLSDFEVKELIEVLKGRNCEYLVTKENIVLIKSQCLFSVIDLSVIDQQFENRMRSVNQKIIYDSIMQNLND